MINRGNALQAALLLLFWGVGSLDLLFSLAHWSVLGSCIGAGILSVEIVWGVIWGFRSLKANEDLITLFLILTILVGVVGFVFALIKNPHSSLFLIPLIPPFCAMVLGLLVVALGVKASRG